MALQIAFASLVTYLIASIPFAVLVGYAFLGVDIRQYGDGNPGATNVRRAGGTIVQYVIALLLDGFKGLFPVGIPYWFWGWSSMDVLPIACAALLGHSFSLYLGFRGGKAIATTGGIWIGLIVFEAVLVIPLTLVYWFYVIEEDAWAVLLMMLSLLGYLLYTRSHDIALLMIWSLNCLLIMYTHRQGLCHFPPTLKRRWHNSSS